MIPKEVLLVLAVLLFACDTCGKKQPEDAGFTMSGACARSFPHVARAWSEVMGAPVPARCERLDVEYEIALVSASVMEEVCPLGRPLAKNEKHAECVKPGELVMFILDQDKDYIAMTDAAVHAWVHALIECATKNLDVEHMNHKLWVEYTKPDNLTVEARALQTREAGACLP